MTRCNLAPAGKAVETARLREHHATRALTFCFYPPRSRAAFGQLYEDWRAVPKKSLTPRRWACINRGNEKMNRLVHQMRQPS
jgi:hypothetical protein